MSQSFNLYQLQRIDTKMDQLRQRVEKANVAIKDHKEIDTLQENLHSLEKTRDELLDHIGSVDAEIQSKKIKINQSESSLYGGKVQNPKELQALQAEIASLTNFVTAKEKELSVLMQEFESMEIQVDKARTTLEDGVALKQKNDQRLSEENHTNLKDLEKLDSERQLAVSQIKPQHLVTYEEIRKKKKNIAVTIVEDNTCSACGVSITPSDWQAARSPDQIIFCPSCSRILYAG
jgi:predicted  nucleic acid-binding Zn-ribbon protein